MLELEKTNFEKAYAELLDKLELEKSVLSDWEVEKLRQDFIRGEIEVRLLFVPKWQKLRSIRFVPHHHVMLFCK